MPVEGIPSPYRGEYTASLRKKPHVFVLLAASLLCVPIASCSRGGSADRVNLPPTPVLSIRTTWAVVKSPLLRIREEPSNKSPVLSHIRMGAVVEIIAKSDKTDALEDEVSFWYRVNFDGLKGWVFGTYIEIFDSRSKANSYSETLQ